MVERFSFALAASFGVRSLAVCAARDDNALARESSRVPRWRNTNHEQEHEQGYGATGRHEHHARSRYAPALRAGDYEFNLRSKWCDVMSMPRLR